MSKHKPAGETIKAAGILLMSGPIDHAEFLLMKHADRWDLPKGHCEPGESFLETALRETEEETGIAAQAISIDPEFQIDLNYPVTYKRSGDRVFEKQVRYFLGFLESKPKIRLTEHLGAQWHRWNPPHHIQSQTVDVVLDAVARHWKHSRPG